MLRVYKIVSVLLLLFNLLGALYGGINLILYPDGSSIKLSLDLLKHSPFKNYLIPGIILFIANGLFCGFVLFKVLTNSKTYEKLIIAQGLILAGWIIIQIQFIRTIFILHFILGGVGVLLVVLGLLIYRIRMKK